MSRPSEPINIAVEPRRLKIAAMIVLTASVFVAVQQLDEIADSLDSIDRAMRAEFDATRTPASEGRRVGEYDRPDQEDGDGG